MNKHNNTIGQQLSPILEEIEDKLIEFEAYENKKPEYTIDGFRAALKIFMSVLVDKTFDKQMRDGKTLDDACNETEMLGYELRALILKSTGIDTHKLYDTPQ